MKNKTLSTPTRIQRRTILKALASEPLIRGWYSSTSATPVGAVLKRSLGYTTRPMVRHLMVGARVTIALSAARPAAIAMAQAGKYMPALTTYFEGQNGGRTRVTPAQRQALCAFVMRHFPRSITVSL